MVGTVNFYKDAVICLATSVHDELNFQSTKGYVLADLKIAAWYLENVSIPGENPTCRITSITCSNPNGSIPRHIVAYFNQQIPNCVRSVAQHIHSKGSLPYYMGIYLTTPQYQSYVNLDDRDYDLITECSTIMYHVLSSNKNLPLNVMIKWWVDTILWGNKGVNLLMMNSDKKEIPCQAYVERHNNHGGYIIQIHHQASNNDHFQMFVKKGENGLRINQLEIDPTVPIPQQDDFELASSDLFQSEAKLQKENLLATNNKSTRTTPNVDPIVNTTNAADKK